MNQNRILKRKNYPLNNGYIIQTITGEDDAGVFYYIAVLNSEKIPVEKYKYKDKAIANKTYNICKERYKNAPRPKDKYKILPSVPEDMRDAILCAEQAALISRDEVIAYYKEHPEQKDRALYLRKIYSEDKHEFMVNNQIVGLQKKEKGLHIWIGRYLDRTHESIFPWIMLQACIHLLIKWNKFCPTATKKAAVTAPSAEQISLFDSPAENIPASCPDETLVQPQQTSVAETTHGGEQPKKEEESDENSQNYRLLSRMKFDCEYFLGFGERSEKHLWGKTVHEHIRKMRELYSLLPEKPEWLTMEQLDDYAKRMAPRYLVVVYHPLENGFDEKLDYQTIKAAEEAAQAYVAGTYDDDGFAYDGAAIYDLVDKKYLQIFGMFPDEKAEIDINPAPVAEDNAPAYKVGDTVYPDDRNVHFFANQTEPMPEDILPDSFFEDETSVPEIAPVNFRLTEASEERSFSPKERYQQNIAAIKTLLMIEQENRYATKAEQAVLAQYVGWGGLADAFDAEKSSWSAEYAELKALLNDAEYTSARESTLSAHYTSPIIIQNIYDALEKFGFTKGNILEPSMGIGNFFSMLPESMQESKLYGVELDSITGRIAKLLYPLANINVCGFENTNFPNNFFDVAIGNVPFGDFKVSDREYDKLNFLIHDFFFAKALDKVRPGGIVIFITSKGTMDKKNSIVREYIGKRAELLGAIRLPNTAFKANANTEATADILFLKKRDCILARAPEDWKDLDYLSTDIAVNRYFVEHPEMILGQMEMVSGPFGMRATCTPNKETALSDLLSAAVYRIDGKIDAIELDEDIEGDADESIPATPNARNFSFTLVNLGNGRDAVYFREGSVMYPLKTAEKTEQRIRKMIEIRECVYHLIDMQVKDTSDEVIKCKQHDLTILYDAFVKKFGWITNEGNRRAFKEDDSYQLLCALEVLDDEGKYIGKADIFTKRTINPKREITSVDTAIEALAVSMNEYGRIDIDFMLKLTGMDKEKLLEDLNEQIFMNPVTEKWESADEYLSGAVVNKLSLARNYAAIDPKYAVNVTALEKVQPKKLEASEIDVRLGATWLDPKYIDQFMKDIFKTSSLLLEHSIQTSYDSRLGKWQISGKNRDTGNAVTNATYGTLRLNAYQLLEKGLNLQDPKIYDYEEQPDGSKKAVINKQETSLAQSKLDMIKDAFTNWIFQDTDRRMELVETYNAMFNTRRPREYDGSHLQFHNMAPDIEMKPHQKNAIARILYGNNNTLLAHTVGAGKTFVMAAAAMELRYLGLCNKAIFVVPNHLTGQWASEFLRLYPSAKVLATGKKDFEKKNRRRFCAKIATGDYDAVIIGHSQFEKIPVSAERQATMIQEQIDELEYAIHMADMEKHTYTSVKQLESKKKKLETHLEKLLQSNKDSLIEFEQLGVDRLFVDESHNYKNLFMTTKMSNVAGIPQTEAKKSTDMYMKCRYMDEITGSKGTIFATGTPISNSMTELYTNMRYLQYETLHELGLSAFDNWASTFGETQTVVELAPEGNKYQTKKRFARFFNLPELINIFKESADVQTADMLNLPRPDAEYINIKLNASEEQQDYLMQLAARADKIRCGNIDPTADNMLKITNDGRKLALDQRLIGYSESKSSKVNACIENALREYNESSDIKGAQLIFSDLATPTGTNNIFNIYDAIRDRLIENGIPEQEIAYIHDANTDAKKVALFAKVRSGAVRFLLGSTAKMGAGTNVQNRLVALHHVDVPWRPSDLEQREGRILRQGNMNKSVRIYRYVTESTFDSYSWQIVENKQKFIAQIMTSKSPVRSAEDIDETTLSYGEVKALATGNPLIKEKMDLDVAVSKLKLLKNNYLNQKYRLEENIVKHFPQQIEWTKNNIAGLTADIASMKQYTAEFGEEFFISYNIGEQQMILDNRADAGEFIASHFAAAKNEGIDLTFPQPIGSFFGFSLQIKKDMFDKCIILKGENEYKIEIGSSPVGNILRMENKANELPKFLESSKQKLVYLEEQFETAKIEVTKPFTQEEELNQKLARLSEVNALLNVGENVPLVMG